MIYNFICDNCGDTKEIMSSIQEGPPKEVFCECGAKMHRDWMEISFHIPEHMRAGSDDVSPTEIGKRLNRSRPSGKRKVIY